MTSSNLLMKLLGLIALCGVLISASTAIPRDGRDSLPEEALPDQLGNANEQVNDTAPITGTYGLLTPEHVHGNESSHSPPTIFQSWYMCCIYSNSNATSFPYNPPFGCIYGPSTGVCQGNLHTVPWVCEYQPGLRIGTVVSLGLLAPLILLFHNW